MDASLGAAAACDPLARGVHEALARALPSVPISIEWLTECIAHLCAHDASQAADPDALYAGVHTQLLVSDLHDSLAHGSVQDLARLPLHVLVQITAVTDVGVSAQTLLDTLALHRDGAERVFPRCMLRVQLSDGFALPFPGYECTRIPELELGRTLLGAKLLLRRPQCRHRALLLTPDTVQVLGGSVPELVAGAQEGLEEELRRRLGQAPRDVTAAPPPRAQNHDGSLGGTRLDETWAPPHLRAAAPVRRQPSPTASEPPPAADGRPLPPAEPVRMDDGPEDSCLWDVDAEQALQEAERALQGQPPCAPNHTHTARVPSARANQPDISTPPNPSAGRPSSTSKLLQKLGGALGSAPSGPGAAVDTCVSTTTPDASAASATSCETPTQATERKPLRIPRKRTAPPHDTRGQTIDLVSDSEDEAASIPRVGRGGHYIALSSDTE
ncbi:hypothetical protein MSPP1_000477 [Malassezia sp. CBS 17886]|nr:hypothetical protein MSPP1_000477 [Malassezia sp. CBS 17886]